MSPSPDKAYSSNPDLSTQNKEDEKSIDKIDKITLRKRKRPEDLVEEKFDTLSSDIEAKIVQLNADVLSSISNITTNIDAIVKKSLLEVSTKQQEILNEVNDLKKTVQFLSSKHDEFEHKINNFTIYSKKIDNLESEILTLKKENSSIKEELNSQQQWARSLNLEITGVPESKSELLVEVVTKIAEVSGITLAPSDIEYTSRVQPRYPVAGRPKTIIVKLKSRLIKDSILSGVRKQRGITTRKLGMHGQEQHVYVNEHLSNYNKTLLKRCRELAKSKQYQFVWTKNCRIFVRKTETKPPIWIKDEEDLKKIQ